ncbi:MAG: hypothetical protein HIU81_09630 [Acidobacteria bacterium]|nr:hypothetical protein [Acidobacteriota bacterium]
MVTGGDAQQIVFIVLNDGTAMAWGSKDSGQLGTDGTGDSPFPVLVPAGVKTIVGGASNSAAIKKHGTVWAWGPSYILQSNTSPHFLACQCNWLALQASRTSPEVHQ